ncbi:N-acetyltransferase [Companilactobacillus sp. RD055328]|uniref:GNAT family N-acetyltransferase n=1 Tax=Companilactobacillus sp. RD055328 TaxID=2916634 RepID=UPI001FC7EC5A|nr:GNAT family N-acetyltransferase [Companilactobacillus sp. RD055328]GKQ43431.1 N-acetyltransferase [Companilactobacillus sp. RD055328]
MTTITTDRLILRPIENSDKPELKQLVYDKTAMAYVRYRMINTDEDFDEAFQNHFLNNSEVFAIAEKQTNELIGFFEFHFDSDEPNITYALRQVAWGKGYASEAGIPLIKYAFENLQVTQLYGYHAENNPNSGKVMQKMGMHFVEKWDETSSVDGTFMTVYKYKIEKPDK